MDKDVLATLGATVMKVSVEYNRKVGDGNFGSIGASMTVEASIAAGADPDAAANGLYEFCKTAVVRNLKPEAVAARESVSHPAVPGPVQPQAPIPPPSAPVAQTPPVAQVAQHPIQAAELDIVTLDAPLVAHVVDQGESRLKVFGGAWKKFGISVYPEVIAQYGIVGWEQWPVCKVSKTGAELGNRYALPGGFQRVEVEVGKDGKPQRVHAFR